MKKISISLKEIPNYLKAIPNYLKGIPNYLKEVPISSKLKEIPISLKKSVIALKEIPNPLKGVPNSLKKTSFTLVVLLLLIAGGAYAHERTSSCVVGVNGADATVTVKGFRSSSMCTALVESKKHGFYERESTPEGRVLCEVQNKGRRYVVRDRGTFMFIGRNLCSSIEDDLNALEHRGDRTAVP